MENCNTFGFAMLVIQEEFTFLYIDCSGDAASAAAPSDSGFASEWGNDSVMSEAAGTV
jgi:hypothetical protein